MIAKIKSLANDSLIYGLSNIVSRMISIWLIPLYTRIFAPADYGVLNLVNNTFFLVGMLSICALDSAVSRWYYDKEDDQDRKSIFASWFWFQLALSVLLALLMIIATPLAAESLLEIPLAKASLLWILACGTLIVNILPNILLNWYRMQRKALAAVWFSLAQSIVTIALTILFVVVLKWHIAGVYMALFTAGLAFSMVAYVQLKEWLLLKWFSREKLKAMLKFSLPLVPAAIAYWLLNSTDAYFLLYFKDKAEVGLFSIGASLASGVYLFTGAFQQAWGAFAYSIAHEKDARDTYANVFLLFGCISAIVILAMFFFSSDVLMLLTTSNYYEADWVASILSINVILIAMTYIASIGANIAKTTLPYSFGIMLAAVLNILFNILFIPVWGKEGSALATVAAQLIVPVYLFYKSHQLYPVPYPYKTVGIILSSSVLIGILVKFIEFPSYALALSSKVVILIILLTGLFLWLKKTVGEMLKKMS